MRILLITSEEWNDSVYANGVLTNWFTGFDAEFAQIYTSPGKPLNNICHKYFQIKDIDMAKSVFGYKRAGSVISMPESQTERDMAKQNERRKGIYGVFKNISLHFNSSVQLVRDAIWLCGRYDKKALKEFIDSFNPDIVFCPRRISPKLIRLEKIVSQMTPAPFVAFTGDDEASLNGYSLSPLYWLRKAYIHNRFKKHVRLYSYYLMHSEDQADEYSSSYGVKTGTIFKCGDFNSRPYIKDVGCPIRMVYAGRLYCNRWKSLSKIGDALKIINEGGVKMVLDIYTQERLTKKQEKALSEDKYIYFKGCVSSEQLSRIYRESDIALHVESMDKQNRMLTRVSFSTKIIDLMSSTCAVMAICWKRHCGMQYLVKNNAAFCISDYEDILPMLSDIVNNPAKIGEYAEKAYRCGKANHERDKIQAQLKAVFTDVI